MTSSFVKLAYHSTAWVPWILSPTMSLASPLLGGVTSAPGTTRGAWVVSRSADGEMKHLIKVTAVGIWEYAAVRL